MFQGVSFIKTNQEFNAKLKFDEPAPMFRKTFFLSETNNAKLSVCGLGYAYYFINGRPVTQDLYTAPVSDYDKILWYNSYDVSHLLKKGKNVIAVIAGNGFFNENFETPWDFHIARWRDNPKFILELSINEKRAVVSDHTWKCTAKPLLINPFSPYIDILDKELRTTRRRQQAPNRGPILRLKEQPQSYCHPHPSQL